MTPENADRVARAEALVAVLTRLAESAERLHQAFVRVVEANEKLARLRRQ